MCNCDCKPRRVTHSIPNTGTDGGTINIPDGVFIWDIIISQGTTALADTVTLSFKAKSLEDQNILSLAAGVADDSSPYAIMRHGASSADGSSISGTAVPWYLPAGGGIEVDIGGSGIGTNTATATILFSECPPPWR